MTFQIRITTQNGITSDWYDEVCLGYVTVDEVAEELENPINQKEFTASPELNRILKNFFGEAFQLEELEVESSKNNVLRVAYNGVKKFKEPIECVGHITIME